MNAQEAARILAKENDSVVVVGIIREATGDLISDECFLNLDEFHAAVVCANLVGYILKIQKRKNSMDHIRIHFKNSKEEKLYGPHIERRQAVS